MNKLCRRCNLASVTDSKRHRIQFHLLRAHLSASLRWLNSARLGWARRAAGRASRGAKVCLESCLLEAKEGCIIQ